MTKTEYVGRVENLGDVYQDIDSLDAQLSNFRRDGIHAPCLVSPSEVAQIRLAGVSNDWSRTRMLPLKVYGEKTILCKSLLVSDPLFAILAVNAHRGRKFPELSDYFYDVAKELAQSQESLRPEDRDAMILSKEGYCELTLEMGETRFILGDFAEEYFSQFNHNSIPLLNLPSDIIPSKGNCTANYGWLSSPEEGSSFHLGNTDLGNSSRAFAILRNGAAPTD